MQQSVTFEGSGADPRRGLHRFRNERLPADELHAQGKPATLPFILRIQKSEAAEYAGRVRSGAHAGRPRLSAPAIALKTVESVDGSVTYLSEGHG